MEENRFFRYVWHFNGLILSTAGILLIGVVLLYAFEKIFMGEMRDKNVRNIVNVQEENDAKEKWQLGYMLSIQGSSHVMIPLKSDKNHTQSYGSNSYSSVRNYLFINSQNNNKFWLFKTNKYWIANADLLPADEYGSKKRDVRAILYKVVKYDSNDDNRLNIHDLKTVAISLPNGKKYKEILEGIDVFVGQRLIGKNTLLIVYQKKGVGFSASVNLSDFTIANEAELPKVGP